MNTHNNINNKNNSSIRIKTEPIEACIKGTHQETYQTVHSLNLSPEPQYTEKITLSKPSNKNKLRIDLN